MTTTEITGTHDRCDSHDATKGGLVNLIMQVTSDEILELAFDWLCRQRKHHGHNSDVWDFRWRWDEVKPLLQEMLRAGCYRLGATRRVEIDGDIIEIWAAQDALVLKAVAIVLSREWDGLLSRNCHHLAGRGGSRAAVRRVCDTVSEMPYVFRTDVKKYYASINHEVLLGQVRQHVDDEAVFNLIEQYVRHSVNDGGLYHDVEQGICLGCSLSPLMGALYLLPLDEAIVQSRLFYARFMDDWVILSPSRWKLRRAVAVVNRILNELKVEQHPGKTFIGKVCRGFDFLGYHFTPSGLQLARQTVERFVARISRLYEQGADSVRIGQYVRRWRGSCTGLDQLSRCMNACFPGDSKGEC